MPSFLREYDLIIGEGGSSDAVQIKNLQIDFKVIKTLESDGNSCELNIFNLNPDTRAKLNKADQAVILKAGYDGDLKTIFIGTTVRTSHVKLNTDTVTQVNCKDGLLNLREARTNRGFPAGYTLERILREMIIGDLKLSIGEVIGDNLNKVYQNGVTIDGPTKRNLDKLTKPFNLQWSIQDGVVDIIGKTSVSTQEVPLKSPTTGLIGTPELQDGVKDSLKGEGTPTTGISFRTLLDGSMRCGRPVRVESEFINSNYKITKITHSGSLRGQSWETYVEGDKLGNA